MIYEYDVVIVGGAIVGLVAALEDEGYESYIEDQEKNTSGTSS
jgi:thioredoxin reductase